MTEYTVAVLEDAIQILDRLSENPDGLSLAQITESSGFVKNKVFRILYTLEKHRMVERDERGHYHPGSRLQEFGQGFQNRTTLLEASGPVMDRLVVETRESIFLGVVNGWDALCIAVRESPRSIRLYAQVGRRAPLHSGGVPKVLFAFMPDDEREALLDHFGENEQERKALAERLSKIQEDGYVVVVDELDIGAHSIAAPIHNQYGQVIAAISIAGPSNRFDAATIPNYVKLVCQSAQQISRALGYEMTSMRELESLDIFI